ncbi:MAG TPA: HypC/HybG/HupF family hydrogenase formation chaperone [Candidatus Nanoarchaeia archaeon]|nr:HypC/HybG/HupF family hydrogenase formation chaperone [Candidatus Nanoarchaeia archaeon]
MCLAVPGKIIEIKDGFATVDYEIEKRKGKILENSFKKGDYVIIQGGFVVQKVGQKEAKEALKLYKQSVSN